MIIFKCIYLRNGKLLFDNIEQITQCNNSANIKMDTLKFSILYKYLVSVTYDKKNQT